MGLICSGEVSDATLYFLCETWFVDSPEIRAEFGLVGYWRFKDDIMLDFAGGPVKMLNFMELYMDRATPFRVKCE